MIESTKDSHLLRILELCLIILWTFTMLTGCVRKQQAKETLTMRDINVVMEEQTATLMAIPGVTGVAIGQLDDGTPCILILVEEETPELSSKLPKAIEHHPVKIMVSGKIVPMDGK